jgi:hypothetical protein
MFPSSDRRGFLRSSLVAGAAVALPGAAPSAVPTPAPREEGNPRVRPGRIHWHEDFAAACAASARSGKPVLHFHMMGRLDERFC